MPEIQSSESQETDRLSSILAGYLTQKDLAQALGVSERTIARWHHFREGPPRVEFGRKVSSACMPRSPASVLASVQRYSMSSRVWRSYRSLPAIKSRVWSPMVPTETPAKRPKGVARPVMREK